MTATGTSSMTTAVFAAFATGPISFFDPLTGKQYFIPLTDITFVNGMPVLNSTVASQLPAGAQNWITYLGTVNAIVPTTVAAPAGPIAP